MLLNVSIFPLVYFFSYILWNSSTLATSCEELTHWKRLWRWEGLGAGGEGDDRGWDGWMASLTRWTWVWVNSGSWWWTERPGMLRFMGLQRVRHDWATDLIWSDLIYSYIVALYLQFYALLLNITRCFLFSNDTKKYIPYRKNFNVRKERVKI